MELLAASAKKNLSEADPGNADNPGRFQRVSLGCRSHRFYSTCWCVPQLIFSSGKNPGSKCVGPITASQPTHGTPTNKSCSRRASEPVKNPRSCLNFLTSSTESITLDRPPEANHFAIVVVFGSKLVCVGQYYTIKKHLKNGQHAELPF